MNDDHENVNPNNPPEFYYGIIPLHILDNPELDDSEKLLLVRISSLRQREGYCYASDKYFAEKMNCSERQIKRRLQRLEELGYIHRDTTKLKFGWHRKIYVTDNFSNKDYEGTPMSPRRVTHVPSKGHPCPNNNISNNNIRKTTTRDPQNETSTPSKESQVSSLFSSLEKLKISKKKKEDISRRYNEEEVEIAVDRVLKWQGRKSDEAALEFALKHSKDWNDKLTKEEQKKVDDDQVCTLMETNKQRFFNFVKKFPTLENVLRDQGNYFLVIMENGSQPVGYLDEEFENILQNIHKKFVIRS